jgi:hypothetical protein
MQATSGKYNNHVNNRLGISGIVINLAEVSEQGKNVTFFDLQFPQEGADDAILHCRADDPRIVNFARRVRVGFAVEVGGMLCQDADGRYYVQACYAQFVKRGGPDAAKTIDSAIGR